MGAVMFFIDLLIIVGMFLEGSVAIPPFTPDSSCSRPGCRSETDAKAHGTAEETDREHGAWAGVYPGGTFIPTEVRHET